MLRSTNDLKGYRMRALDDHIGSASDLYFDDQSWAVRYLVVDTGKWLPGRLVLISPIALGQPDWKAQDIPVSLTRKQIEGSPGIQKDEPVTSQKQTALYDYYRWPTFWPHGLEPPILYGPADTKEPETQSEGNPHLRSANEVTGYHIEARDGSIGHVEDLIIDDDAWEIRYIIVDTRNWLPGKKVIVAPQWIEQVVWAQAKVHVNLTKEAVEHAPEYDPSQPVNREYEVRLYDYYGRPHYWA
jgi:hypothetical protein